MTAGRMGKYIMALTAAGIDCTKVNDNGTVRNLVAEMEALEKPESMSVYDAVCILPVYQYGSYKQGDSAMAPSALIDLILANADDKGLFGSAQPDEQVAQQQAQEQSASASSTSVKQSTSGQPDNFQDGGDKASSAEDGKAKDENSSTDSSQEQSEGSSSEQASQSDASSGGSGHPAQQRLTHPRTLALHLLLVLRQLTRSLNPNPPLRRRPARFPFTSASIARARKAMAWEASPMAPRSCSPKAPRCTTPCARPALPFPARPIM